MGWRSFQTVTAFVPSDVADAGRMKIMQAFGARFTPFAIDGELGDLAGRRQCLDLTETETGVWWSRQFSNPHNVAVHRETTAKEIIEKTDGRLDAFVASVGSGGNLLGVGQALKEHDPNIRVIGVEPDSWRVLSAEHLPVVAGLSGGTSAALRESGIVDEVITLDDATAIQMAHRLAQEEGAQGDGERRVHAPEVAGEARRIAIRAARSVSVTGPEAIAAEAGHQARNIARTGRDAKPPGHIGDGEGGIGKHRLGCGQILRCQFRRAATPPAACSATAARIPIPISLSALCSRVT